MIHETAVVDTHAEIDSGAEVGPFCVIGPEVKIAKGNRLLGNVTVFGRTTINENNTFFPGSVIGAIPQDLKYDGEPTRLNIGRGNTIREMVTLNLGTEQGGGVTEIGNNNLLMAYVHVGHDCKIGNHTIIANQVGLAGHVTVHDYVNLGGMVGISQFVEVGAYSYVTGQSGLEKALPPFCIAVGSRPCTIRGANIVGLRRRGFSAEVITQINEAIKLWTRPEVQKEQCLLEIESQYGDVAEVRGFIDFVKNSKQGAVK